MKTHDNPTTTGSLPHVCPKCGSSALETWIIDKLRNTDAALAERERVTKIMATDKQLAIQQLRKLLDAERDKWIEALAAEREATTGERCELCGGQRWEHEGNKIWDHAFKEKHPTATGEIDAALDNAITALGQCQKGTARQFLQSAINAALVAARDAGYEECRKLWQADVAQLDGQLAAEREKIKWWHEGTIKEYEKSTKKLIESNKQLREQLDAAVEQLAVEWNLDEDVTRNRIAELAKIGGKP